jgi:hypothetical protein
VVVLAWPLLKMREHRRRLVSMLVLVVVVVACALFGQFMVDGLSSWCAAGPAACRRF